MTWKLCLSLLLAVLLALPAVACGAKPNSAGKTTYPAAAITTPEQADTINSLKRLNEEGTFYQMDYTADYDLDGLLEADVANLEGLMGWVQSTLLSADAKAAKGNMGSGCSAFAGINADGELIFARNYDYVQNAQNILVHCNPKDGYESASLAAGGWLYTNDADGNFVTLDDGKTDLSMLVAAPYLLMDGMNEKGVVMCVLTLDGSGTVQNEPGRHSIQTTTAMRLVLDRAASVPEAIELLKQYNMKASISVKNFHFFIADAAGNYGIIEYSPEGEMRYSANERGDCCNLLSAPEADFDQRFVTNFYCLFPSAEYRFDDGQHGLDRYEVLQREMENARGHFTEEEAMTVLGEVYQDFGATATHETQWSVVYNPTKMTAKICPRVVQTDLKDAFYATAYEFDFMAEFKDSGTITHTVSHHD